MLSQINCLILTPQSQYNQTINLGSLYCFLTLPYQATCPCALTSFSHFIPNPFDNS